MSELRVPPHSVEAEQAVLGGLMLDNCAWEQVADRLQETDFYRHDHRLVFRALKTLADCDKPCDAITVSEWLEARELLDEVGGLTYVGALAKESPGAANIKAYTDIVRERSVLRRLIVVGNDIASSAFHPAGKTIAEVIDASQSKILEIERPTGKGPRKLISAFGPWAEKLDKRLESGGSLVGCSTGIRDLDLKTLGMEPGDLWILAARPSMGKTTLAMNVMESVAGRGEPVLFFSLEMPEEQLLTRAIASLGRLDSERLRMGTLEPDEWSRVTAASNRISEMPLFVDDQPALSITEMRARARRLKRQHGLALIVVDYLQLIEGTGESTNAVVSGISRGLKGIAKDLQVPVLALSQLNRSLESRQNKRPIMSDLRDSGSIEQDADVIAFLYRESQYNRNCEFDYVAELDVSKQRNGPTGQLLLAYAGSQMRFSDLDQVDAQNYRSWQREASARPVRRGFEA